MSGLNNNILQKIKELKPFFEKSVLNDIYSWKELEQFLNFRPAVTDRNLTLCKTKRYEWLAGGWLTEPNSYPADLLNSELKKSVCYIKDCSRVNKKINNISKQLEDTLGHPTDTHIYFSLNTDEGDNTGFGKHKDTQHNIITNVDGSFNIKLFEDDNIIIDEDMQPGDIIFIPAGTYHLVTPKTKRLSLSFAMSPLFDYFQTREWLTL